MNLEDFRDQTKGRDGKDELVIVSSDTGHTYSLPMVSLCMNDRVVMLHAKLMKSEELGKCQITVDKAQLDFLLWSIGYIFGASDNMSEAHKAFIGLHHAALLPILVEAKDL
jgi:hypothetical protein